MELTLRSRILLILPAFAFADPCSAWEDLQPTVSVAQLPQSARCDLGRHRFGEPVNATIQLRNALKTHLTIRVVDPDCGCLSVEPNKRVIEPNESIELAVELAASKQLANIRRNIRIFFDEFSAPLVLKVDVKVVGPFQLESPGIEITSTANVFQVSGSKTEPALTIRDWKCVRGSFHIEDPIEQTSDRFVLTAKPLFTFGSANDLIRITYDDATGEGKVIDLPIELRVSAPVRFLPSTVNLSSGEDDLWKAKTRMIVSPGSDPFDVSPKAFRPYYQRGEQIHSVRAEIDISRVSSVLYTVNITANEKSSPFLPNRLDVHGSRGEVLGTLFLSIK